MANAKTILVHILGTKKDSNYLDVKLKVFERENNKHFRLFQNLSMAEADFNQFMQLWTYLAIVTKNFGREENLVPVLTPTMSKNMDEQLKLAQKVFDVVDRVNRKIYVTLRWYNVEKPESSYAKVRLFAKKNKDEKFQRIFYVKSSLAEFISLLDVMKSLYGRVITKKPICNVLKTLDSVSYSLSFFFSSSQFQLELSRCYKPICQVQIKVGILSCCAYNFKSFCQKLYTNCS